MRFHVVGVGGGTGALLSYHIKRASRLLGATTDNYAHSGYEDGYDDRGRRIGSSSNHVGTENLGNLPNPSILRHLPKSSETGITLRMRKASFIRKATENQQNRIIIEKDGIEREERDFNMQWTNSFESVQNAFRNSLSSTIYDPDLAGMSICESIGYPKGTIDSLLVATKAQHTIAVLEPLVRSLSPASTLILMQNGQGTLDEVIQKYFPDPQSRPNIVIASSTHKLWTKTRLHAVHHHSGSIDFAVIPNPNIGSNFERIWKPSTFIEDDEIRRQIAIGGGQNISLNNHEFEADQQFDLDNLSSGGSAGKGGFGWFAKRNHQHSSMSALDRSYATAAPNQLLSIYANPPLSPLAPTLDMDAIPVNDHTRTLTATLAILQSLPLDVRWQPIRRYQLRAMQKLVTSACIEPITALVGCRNGHLFGNRFAEEAMRDVCNEASMVLRKMAERTRKDAENQLSLQQQQNSNQDWFSQHERNQDYLFAPEDHDLTSSSSLIGNFSLPDHPMLDPSLQPGALLENVRNTIKRTAPHFSAMYSDLNTNKVRNTSEIAYINGYIGRMGRSLGITTPVNDMLVSMIRLKQSKDTNSPWKLY